MNKDTGLFSLPRKCYRKSLVAIALMAIVSSILFLYIVDKNQSKFVSKNGGEKKLQRTVVTKNVDDENPKISAIVTKNKSFFSKNGTKNVDENFKPSQEPKDSFITFLKNHSVFKTFNVSRVYKKKKRVHILVIVSTAPKRRDRRDSIRQTWWKRCVQIKKVFI